MLVLVAIVAALAGIGASPLSGDAVDTPAADAQLAMASEPVAMATASLTLSAEQALLELTNADRVQNGLAPLQLDGLTLGLARERATSQLSMPSLTHYDATGQLAFVRLLQAAGVEYQLAGENLARAAGVDVAVTGRVEEALMRSPTHRKNILEQSFTRVAIGAAVDGDGRIAFAEIFRAE